MRLAIVERSYGITIKIAVLGAEVAALPRVPKGGLSAPRRQLIQEAFDVNSLLRSRLISERLGDFVQLLQQLGLKGKGDR